MVESDLTGRILAAAINVHKSLGPGYLESIYEEALAIELEYQEISFERQTALPIYYREKKIGEHRLDLLVEKKVVVELKAVSEIEKIHFAIVRSYLKALNLQHGLLLNFSTIPITIKRVGREDAARIKNAF